jgi:hypothetical protein
MGDSTVIINLTPHNIDIYDGGAPDVIRPHMKVPVRISIPAAGEVARIVEYELGTQHLKGAEALPAGIELVEYGHVVGLPDVRDRTWYVVSLATALAKPGRPDLLVPWRQVRNEGGTVIGCRGLARPC